MKIFPIWCNVKFSLFFFVLLNAVKPVDIQLTLHHIRKILLSNIKIKFKIWRVTFLKSFFTIKKIWDVLPIFVQERIYHVRTEMRQSLVYADFALRYSETCL